MDGTLIRTDVLWESVARMIKQRPQAVLALPFWLLRGRAYLKKQVAQRVEFDPANLPYHHEFLQFLHEERDRGRKLILVTASDDAPARQVAKHVGIFSDVMASNGKFNLRGSNKGRILAEQFGKRGFDYAGNSSVDLPVWQEARRALVVNADERLADRARERAEVERVFHHRPPILPAAFRALRPHQWIKNVIIFVPLLTSHNLLHPHLLVAALLAFVAFCFCASAVYVLNDLLDLDADRHHGSKKFRSLASGELPLSIGLLMVPGALALSGIIACFLPWGFAAVLGVYFLLTTSYSFSLKQIALLDVFVLAGLYTIRLIAGHEASGHGADRIPYSYWLLAFSMFIFLSLALVKRYTELAAARQQNRNAPKGRGYMASDLELVATLGIASGFLAVLVMALYVNSPEVTKLYQYPIVLLLVCPLLLFWISRVWLLAHRGRMHDDPIVFALRDGPSYLIGALTLLVLWLATGHY
jgi:4-hydroxybenzoate polyprenyltransferase/phosphoserine phosphatase